MSTNNLADNIKQSLKKRDERLFMAIFILSFPIFLAIAMATRLLGSPGEVKRDASILGEASSAARSTIAIALQD
jgi:hypothetical protein